MSVCLSVCLSHLARRVDEHKKIKFCPTYSTSTLQFWQTKVGSRATNLRNAIYVQYSVADIFSVFFCARIGCFHIQYRSSGYYNVILNWRTDVMRSRGENISLNKINLHWIMIIINSRQSNCPREGCTSHRS